MAVDQMNMRRGVGIELMSSIFADEQMYKKYSEQDWKVKDSFSYDSFQVFND